MLLFLTFPSCIFQTIPSYLAWAGQIACSWFSLAGGTCTSCFWATCELNPFEEGRCGGILCRYKGSISFALRLLELPGLQHCLTVSCPRPRHCRLKGCCSASILQKTLLNQACTLFSVLVSYCKLQRHFDFPGESNHSFPFIQQNHAGNSDST